MKRNLLPVVISLAFVVFVSGCLSMSPESLAFANPLVKQFMSQYPNAKITANHFTATQASQILENISAECSNPYITAKEYYRISIDDPDSGLKVIAWIDWENKSIECAVKYGGGGNKTISKPGEETKTCKSHAQTQCYGQHVYWFDSCGHVEEKKEYCQNGCENGFCKENKEGENCTSNAEAKCYEGHVYWYDSCGSKEEKKEYCQNGCENGACKASAGTKCGDGICETVEKTLLLDEAYNFTFYGKTHTVKFLSLAPYSHTASIEFDGLNKEIEKGDAYKISDVSVKLTEYYSEEGQPVKISLVLGETKDSCAVDCGGQSMCTDSDNGKNYYVGGTAVMGTQSLSDHCNADGTLTEKYCENNDIKAETLNCTEGYKCSEDRCVPET